VFSAGRTATRVVPLPEQEAVVFKKSAPDIQFLVPPFEVLSMALVEYA
jgi:hypothetical protein